MSFSSYWSKLTGGSKSNEQGIEAKSKHTSADSVSIVDDFVWVEDTPLSPEKQKITNTLQQFSLTETLAHSRTGAYGAFRRGEQKTVSIQDGPKGTYQDYTIKPIKTDKKGLVAEIFVPQDPSQSQIYINWTGTHSLATLVADIEVAPGEESYRSQEWAILKQINEAVKEVQQKSGKKVDLTITGHSLGGSLAQLNTHSIQRAIASNLFDSAIDAGDEATCEAWIHSEKDYRLAQQKNNASGHEIPQSIRTHLNSETVGSLTLGTWNSAGVLQAVADSSDSLSPMIKQSGVQQTAYFGMVGGDGVQRTGQDNLFSHANPKVVDVHLAKMNVGTESGLSRGFSNMSPLGKAAACTLLLGVPAMISGGLYLAFNTSKAHTSKHFETQVNENKVALYDNHTLAGQKVIQDKLRNKSKFLQWAPVHAIRKQLHNFTSYLTAEAPSSKAKRLKAN